MMPIEAAERVSVDDCSYCYERRELEDKLYDRSVCVCVYT